jgi:sigma-B regulation protein RsbU (phosphoserine phosphatase)
MALTDNFAYIPLFAVCIIASVILFLLMRIKNKGTARVSFILFTATVVVLFTSLVAAIMQLTGGGGEEPKAFAVFATGILFAAFLLIPYCLMLTLFEPQQIVKLVPKSVNRAAAAREQAARAEQTDTQQLLSDSSYDSKILDISRDFMVHAADSYMSEGGLSTFLDYINKTIAEQIKADGGAILMIDDFEDLIAVKSFEGDFPPPYRLPNDMPHKPVRIATNFKFASFPFSGNIFGEVATAGKPELVTDPNSDDRIYQNGPEEFLECGSYIFVPMKIQGVVFGITAFARKHGNELFTEDELRTTTTLSDFAAAAIKSYINVTDIIESSKITKETEISTHIQDSLKPAKLPVIPGLQIGTLWNPAEGVCGDFYDVIVSRKDRVSFIAGDIAGKGMNSTIVMIMVRAMLRLVVNTKQSAGKILTWVNKGIAGESFSNDHFGSVALINYNPEEKVVEFTTGGGTPVYYYDSSTQSIAKISEPTEPIGVEKTTEYKDYVQKVKSGDIIITYTDGLVENLNGEGQQYTKESLLKVISDNHEASGKDIAKAVKNDIKKFSGSAVQHDDETLLLVKIQ